MRHWHVRVRQWQVWVCWRWASEHQWQVWESVQSQLSSLWNRTSYLGTLLVRREIIATTYCSTIVKTHVFSLYSHLCIYVSMYLGIYIPTHLYTIYLDWLQAVVYNNSRCIGQLQSTELRDQLRCHAGVSLEICTWMWWERECTGRNRARLEMPFDTVTERIRKYPWRLWSHKFGEVFRGHVHANLEAVIGRVWRFTRRPSLGEFGEALGGLDRRRLAICTCLPDSSEFGEVLGVHDCANLKALMQPVWRYTSRPWSSQFGDGLGSCDRVWSAEYFEAVDGQSAECWESIHQLGNSQL